MKDTPRFSVRLQIMDIIQVISESNAGALSARAHFGARFSRMCTGSGCRSSSSTANISSLMLVISPLNCISASRTHLLGTESLKYINGTAQAGSDQQSANYFYHSAPWVGLPFFVRLSLLNECKVAHGAIKNVANHAHGLCSCLSESCLPPSFTE